MSDIRKAVAAAKGENSDVDSGVEIEDNPSDEEKDELYADNYLEINNRGEGHFSAGANMDLIHRKKFTVPADRLDNSSVSARIESAENIDTNNRPMTSFIEMDDGSYIFTHAGYFGKMKIEDGQYIIEDAMDITGKDEDFNPYTGVIIGQKINKLTPIRATIYDYRTSYSDHTEDRHRNAVFSSMKNALVDFFEPEKAVENELSKGGAENKSPDNITEDESSKETINEGFNADRLKIPEITNKRIVEMDIDIEAQSDLVKKWLEKYGDTDLELMSVDVDGIEFNFIPCVDFREVAALVKDRDGKYKLRAFRFSGSDHQYKSICAYRDEWAYCKGDEKDPNHHYVQSAKLDRRIEYALKEQPYLYEAWDSKNGEGDFMRRYNSKDGRGEEFDLQFRLASGAFDYALGLFDSEGNPLDTHYKGKDLDDYEFSEKRTEFKNKDWNDTLESLNRQYHTYSAFFHYLKREDSELSRKWISRFVESSGISQENDAHNIIPRAIKGFLEDNQDWNDYIFPKIMRNNVAIKQMEKFGMVPDFSSEPIARFSKQTDQKELGPLEVETYVAKNDQGDSICWDMARDGKGRVYIDNIYDGNSKIDSYGTYDGKINASWLVYKPEDYDSQAKNIPSNLLSPVNGKYVDISKFLELLTPITKYKQALAKRK